MKVSELTRYLRKHGCRFVSHGGSHDNWKNVATGAVSKVPRHQSQELPNGTKNRILAELGLK